MARGSQCNNRTGTIPRVVLALLIAAACLSPGPSRAQAPAAGSSQSDAEEVVQARWSLIPGQALDIAINAAAFAYAAGRNGEALRWRADRQSWSGMSGLFQRVTAAEGNRPWGVTEAGIVQRFNGLWWETKGDNVADVAGDALGNVFVARRDGEIQRWEPLSSSWRAIPGPLAQRIAIDGSGNPWVVDRQGRIHRLADGTWRTLPGLARDIAIGGDGSVAIADAEGRIRGLRDNPLRWVPFTGVSGAVAVAVTPNGGPWAVLADGRIVATTLIREQPPIEEETAAPTPTAPVPQAPQTQAAQLVAPSVQAPAVQAPSAQAPQGSAPQQTAPSNQARSLAAPSTPGGAGGTGTGGGGGSVAGGGGGSVSPSSGGSGSDPAASTTRDALVFTDTRATAAQLAIGRDGSVFALDSAGNITRWNNTRRRLESFPGQLVRLAVDSRGNPWGVTARGRVFRHDGQAWVQIQAATASAIAIGGREDIVVTADARGLLARLNADSGRFDRIAGLGIQLAVAPDGTVWTIRDDQVVQRCDTTPCSPVGQRARSLAIGPDGSVFLVDVNARLLRKRPRDDAFAQVIVPGYTPVQVAVGPNGFPWVVTSDGKILATRFFERDEQGDRALALGTRGDTVGTGATAAVSTSTTTTSFTFTKNLQWERYSSTGDGLGLAALDDVYAGNTGAVFIKGGIGEVFRFNSRTNKFEELTTDFSISGIADLGEDEDGTLWALSSFAPAKVYRLKGTQETEFTVISTSDTGTPRSMSVTAEGAVFVVVGDALYKKAANQTVFRRIASSGVRAVHVGPGEDIWILDENSRVQQYTGSRFENRPTGAGFQAADLAVGADGSIYALDQSTELLKKWNASNGKFDNVNITQTMQKVTVTIEGRPWLANTSDGITSTGDIWRAKD